MEILHNLRKINVPAFLVLIIYPLFLLGALFHYCKYFGADIGCLWIFLLGYYGSSISVGVGVHRLWSHSSYKAHPFLEFLLMMVFSGTLQGPALSWVSNHVDHHSFTDTDRDPHSPLKYKNRLLGFLWSHIGWMILGEGSFKSVNRVTIKKLGKNKILRFQFRYYWQCALFMNLFLPFMLGYIFQGSFWGGYSFFLFIGLGRALQQEVTFFVNSLCHFFGNQKYSSGTSRDVWWLALLLFGENWHNFHHAFPNDYRNGIKWYHLDVHKWIIYWFKILGLAKNLKVTPQSRVDSKMLQLKADGTRSILEERLNILSSKVNAFLDINIDGGLLSRLQKFQREKKENLQDVFESFRSKLDSLKNDLHNQVYTDKIFESISSKLSEIESALAYYFKELEKIYA